MLKTLFGEVKDGRLARHPYLGYIVLLIAISMGIVFGALVLAGGIERMMSGEIQQTQEMLTQKFGIPGLILVLVVTLMLGFANFNITAKRLRDMGLPGWWTMLGIAIVSIAVSLIFPAETIVQDGQSITQASLPSSILELAVFAFTLLVPGNTFGGKSGSSISN